jgi:ATP-binding cassette subfamily F protein uup
MDKIVDHLFIFEGNGEIYDFPGNYSDYRVSQKQQEIEDRRNEATAVAKEKAVPSAKSTASERKKLSYREQKELEALGEEIAKLEQEKAGLETELSGGMLKAEELIRKSGRIGELIELIDRKTWRWMELSEKEG